MKLKNLSGNATELELPGGTLVLFSYQTPVAAITGESAIRTIEFYSKTTSRHINKWLDMHSIKAAFPVEQFEIDQLIH